MPNPLAALLAARALTGANPPRVSPVDCEPYATEELRERPVRLPALRGLAWLRLRGHTRARPSDAVRSRAGASCR